MVVGELAEPVDLLIVGGGVGGYTSALRAAQLGRAVTVVEQRGSDGLGGCCLHVGCIPSKALIELASNVRRVSELVTAGLISGGVSVNVGAFQEWKTDLITHLRNGVAELLDGGDVTVMDGKARFSNGHRIAVELPDGSTRYLEFADVVIATGSRPVQLESLPLDQPHVVDTATALDLTNVPSKLAIIGAGYIGIELGTALAKLGASVTLVEAASRVLPNVDARLVAPVARRLEALGITVIPNAVPLERIDNGLRVRTPSGEHDVAVELIIVAAGRRPNTDDLGLDRANISTTGEGHISVDARGLARDHVAAIGDAVAGPALAHKAAAQGAIAAEVLSGYAATADVATIPEVIFSDPEIATIGLTDRAARAAGYDVRTARFPLSASSRAATMVDSAGFCMVVVDNSTEDVLGVHLVGPHASELSGEAVLAVEMLATAEDLASTVHAHPTLSEAIKEAAAIAVGRPVHAVTGGEATDGSSSPTQQPARDLYT